MPRKQLAGVILVGAGVGIAFVASGIRLIEDVMVSKGELPPPDTAWGVVLAIEILLVAVGLALLPSKRRTF